MKQQEEKSINQPIIECVPVNSPFDMFLEDQWIWISDNSDSSEYTELDEIYLYMSGDRERNELEEHLQTLSDEKLREEYDKRFPILFGNVLEEIGKQLKNGYIKMKIKHIKS